MRVGFALVFFTGVAVFRVAVVVAFLVVVRVVRGAWVVVRVGRGVGLACPETGQLCCFIGSEEEVERQMKELEIRAEKEKSESPEAFTDNVIMYEVLSELRDIASRGGVRWVAAETVVSSRSGRVSSDERRANVVSAAMRRAARTRGDDPAAAAAAVNANRTLLLRALGAAA